MMGKAALAHLTSRDGGNAKGLSETILTLCFAAPARPWAMSEAKIREQARSYEKSIEAPNCRSGLGRERSRALGL